MADGNKFFSRTLVKFIFAALLGITTAYLAFSMNMTAAVIFASLFSVFCIYFLKRFTWMTPPTPKPNPLSIAVTKSFLKMMAGFVLIVTGFITIVSTVLFFLKPQQEAWLLILAIGAGFLYWRAMMEWDKY